jgi:hypothetical protein
MSNAAISVRDILSIHAPKTFIPRPRDEHLYDWYGSIRVIENIGDE